MAFRLRAGVELYRRAEGEFVLMRHSVDAAGGGEIDRQTVVDFGKEPGP